MLLASPDETLKRALAQKLPQYATTGWILHQNNAPGQYAQVTLQVIDQLNI